MQEAVVWNRVPGVPGVAFIVIHDGYWQDPEALAYVQVNKLPVTMFLSAHAPKVFEQPQYFREFMLGGRGPQSHGSPHDDMRGKTYQEQLREITGSIETLEQFYGVPPVMFCPPYGLHDKNTRLAAYAAGLKWMIRWSHAIVDNQMVNALNVPDERIYAGDIVMCHFEEGPKLLNQLQVATTMIRNAGLHPAYLADYVYTFPT
jgi:peptidoglycan/xylan/chitin deacetylase (PgdA/CDA1 family)